jgi:hypothetical protein
MARMGGSEGYLPNRKGSLLAIFILWKSVVRIMSIIINDEVNQSGWVALSTLFVNDR